MIKIINNDNNNNNNNNNINKIIIIIMVIIITKGTIPISVIKSAIISPLILRSTGASIFKEGDKFTSKSHGF